MSTITLYGGSRRSIEAVVRHGACPAREYIDGLGVADRKKILALLLRAGDHWPIVNTEQFKHLDGAIYEFKAGQHRLTCFLQPGARIIITHGFRKKTARTPKPEIARAETIRSHCLEDDG